MMNQPKQSNSLKQLWEHHLGHSTKHIRLELMARVRLNLLFNFPIQKSIVNRLTIILIKISKKKQEMPLENSLHCKIKAIRILINRQWMSLQSEEIVWRKRRKQPLYRQMASELPLLSKAQRFIQMVPIIQIPSISLDYSLYPITFRVWLGK